MTHEMWGQLRQKLLKTVGQNNYTTWIEPLEFSGLEDGIAVFNESVTKQRQTQLELGTQQGFPLSLV